MTQNLAQQLGYGADERLAIFNCDDLGSSLSANLACEEVLRRGFATSATLMVPCPWAREAVERCKDLDIGVHLTLTSEYPLYRWRSMTGAATLHDADGFLPRTAQEMWAKADLRAVEAECRAQIDAALGWGLDVTHLDSHMGTMQMQPEYFSIYMKLAKDYRLPLRMVSTGAERHLGFACREPARENGILFIDHFVLQWGQTTRMVIENAISKMRPGVTEFCLHPVLDGPELHAYDPTQAHIRAHDHACVMDEGLAHDIKRAGIRSISFRPLRNAMRG